MISPFLVDRKEHSQQYHWQLDLLNSLLKSYIMLFWRGFKTSAVTFHCLIYSRYPDFHLVMTLYIICLIFISGVESQDMRESFYKLYFNIWICTRTMYCRFILVLTLAKHQRYVNLTWVSTWKAVYIKILFQHYKVKNRTSSNIVTKSHYHLLFFYALIKWETFRHDHVIIR